MKCAPFRQWEEGGFFYRTSKYPILGGQECLVQKLVKKPHPHNALFFTSLEQNHANHTFVHDIISSLILRRAGHSLQLLNSKFISCNSEFF